MCDEKGPTLTLFKTDDGRVCVGYTSASWDSSNKYKNDPESFLFSLDHKKVFKVKIAERTIYCGSALVPCFGYDAALRANSYPFNDKDMSRSSSSSMTFGDLKDQDGNSMLTGKNDLFTAVEIETFAVSMT